MNFGTEFWSAICGAVVGGVIALGIQLLTLFAAKKERDEIKEERKTALYHSLVFKISRIHSNLFDLHLHLEESYVQSNIQRTTEPWTFVLPIANFPDCVHFSSDEISLILSLNKPDLTDSLISIDMLHNSSFEIFKNYTVMRNDFQNFIPTEMDGNVGTSQFTADEFKVVRPRMVIMNQLLSDVREMAQKGYLESRKAIRDVPESLNKLLGLELKIELKREKLARLNEIYNKIKTK